MEVLQDYSTPYNNGTLPYIFNRLLDTRRRRPTPAARTKRGRKRGIDADGKRVPAACARCFTSILPGDMVSLSPAGLAMHASCPAPRSAARGQRPLKP
jgi:hypothetical protein